MYAYHIPMTIIITLQKPYTGFITYLVQIKSFLYDQYDRK
jgi:hypothetical protein